MKLNNKGWGYGQMFFLMFILIVAFIFLIINANELSNKLNNTSNKPNNSSNNTNSNNEEKPKPTYYEELENDLNKSAREYVRLNNIICDSSCTYEYHMLRDANYIGVIYDNKTDSECDGYVVLKNNTYNSFLKCDSYQTEDY